MANAVAPNTSDPGFSASMAAAANDFSDEIAIGIYREAGDKAAQLVAANILAKSNAAVAALLETPEIINAIANGEDMTTEIAGAVGAVLGGYVGATAGAAAATAVAGFVVATTLPAIAAVGIVAAGAVVGGYIVSSVGEAFFERLFGQPTERVNWLETQNTLQEIYGDQPDILAPILVGLATAQSLGGVYAQEFAEKYGALVTVDRINCFLAGTPITMWPTGPSLKPGPDGVYDQEQVRAGLMLGQDADDLLFAVSRSLYCPSLRWVGL